MTASGGHASGVGWQTWAAHTVGSIVVELWGFAASKAEALELCLDSLSSRPPVVALLETHRFLAPAALPGYSVAAGAQNTSWWRDSATGAATG